MRILKARRCVYTSEEYRLGREPPGAAPVIGVSRHAASEGGAALITTSMPRKEHPMRSRVVLVTVGLLVILLVLMGTIRADISHDASAPVDIPYDQEVSFTLSGNRAGAFAYYSIEYPGDGRVVTIELDLAPGDPVAMNAAGLNVYGPNGYFIGSGVKSPDKVDRKVVQWSDYNRTRWLIQVYNYLHDVPVSFRLKVSGLPAPQPERHVMTPAEATTFSMAGGGLIGDHAGSFHYYTVESNGNGSSVTLRLYKDPDTPVVSQAVGLNVYAPHDGVLAASDSHKVRFDLEDSGTYLVQVYNYLHGWNVNYVLTKE
jgi:hypothetical protein